MSSVAAIVSPGILCDVHVFYPRTSMFGQFLYSLLITQKSRHIKSIYPFEIIIMHSKGVNVQEISDKRTVYIFYHLCKKICPQSPNL
jgi:hypothetical protein